MSQRNEGQDESSESFDSWLQRAARLTPWPVAHQLHPGMELCKGRLQLLRRLGAGGMGVVYEAFDRERGGEVAVKTLSQVSPTGIYRLKNEFRGLCQLMHPNLVRLHDLFAQDGLWLFTMELVNGRPFDEWVRPGGRPELGRLRAGLGQVAAGLEAVHAAGKLHRDIKPSNVLAADGGGRMVILDFGLVADPERGGSGQTRDTGVSGTPHYMAPEQAAGDPAQTASDMYALGVMLFEALTGQLPFDGRLMTIMQRKQRDPAPRASSLAEGVPADLDELCAALLDRDPAVRPDAASLARQLQARPATLTSPPASIELREAVPLVGRDTELGALRRALAAARAGQPTVVQLRGESGIGKSTLVNAFLDETRVDGRTALLAGRCYERESLPYKAFDRVVDEVTRYLRQLREVDAASLLPRHIGALTMVFPVLSRVEVIARHGAPPHADASEMRRRAFDALTELLARIRDRQLLVVHIDDLQWLDHDSTLLLERLLSDPDPPPILYVLATRAQTDAESAALLQRVFDAARNNPRVAHHELALEALPAPATLALANALLQHGHADPGLAQAVASESQGNPFFVGELARHATAVPHDQASLADVGSVTLEHMLTQRAVRLGAGAQALLQTLAVAGRPTPVDVLVQATDAASDPHRALDLLLNARLVRETGKRCFDCYHDRIAAAVRGSLDTATAQRLNRQLATAWASQPGADPEVLFAHWLAAGEPQHAGAFAVQAADNAAANLAFERSADFLSQAIALLPPDEVVSRQLRARRGQALSMAGLWTHAARAFEDAAQTCAEPTRRHQLQMEAARHFLGSGHGEQGLPLLADLLHAAGVSWPRSGVVAMVSAVTRLSWLWLSATRKRNLSRLRELPAGPVQDDPHRADILEHWLQGAGLVPAYDAARGAYFMSVFAARALRSRDVARAGLSLGMLSAVFARTKSGQVHAARLGEVACSLARRHDNPTLRSATLSFIAYAHIYGGRLQQALAHAQEAEETLSSEGLAPVYPAWVARAAQGYSLFAMGRLGDAARIFERLARSAIESGDDLALVGGDAVMRRLVVDDVPGAQALLERKLQLLEHMPRGIMREQVQAERMLCALYQGDGQAAIAQAEQRSWLVAFMDDGMLPACAALQCDPRAQQPRTRRLVRRAVHRLRVRGSNATSEAARLQLTASLQLLDGDLPAACDSLARSADHYASADMQLHAHLMRAKLAGLRHARGEVDADTVRGATQTADDFMRAQGVARPQAWAHMLAPGLAPPTP